MQDANVKMGSMRRLTHLSRLYLVRQERLWSSILEFFNKYVVFKKKRVKKIPRLKKILKNPDSRLKLL